jgi:ABC transporter DrrB family efflux protein
VLTLRGVRSGVTGSGLLTMIANPVVFFCGFAVAFSNLVSEPGMPYEQYLTPAIVVLAAMFVAFATPAYLTADRTAGMLARYRSMPIARPAVLTARLATDAVRGLGSVLVAVIVGYVAGFRFSAGFGATLAFFLLAAGFCVALAAGTARIALGSPQLRAMGGMFLLPAVVLFNLSTALVPAGAFPAWLRPVAEYSPFTAVIEALRSLASAAPTLAEVWPALAWIVGLTVAFGAMTARAIGKAT